MSTKATPKRIAVVGAGIGGMSSAALLAKAGYHVDVYEQSHNIGGKAASINLGQYRFDTGPSLVTMPEVFSNFFESLGETLEDNLTFIPLDPLCNYFWPDGSRLSSAGHITKFADRVVAAGLGSKHEVENYFRKSKQIWGIAGDLFLNHCLHSWQTYMHPKAIKSILQSPQILAFSSLHQSNAKAFSDPRLVQLFDRYATYNGSSPYQTPGTMRIIPHVEYSHGGYAVAGGIVAIPRAIEAAARRAGVNFHTGSKVERIILDKNVVTGIMVNGTKVPCDICVSNADVWSTYRGLLEQPLAKEVKRYDSLEPSSSGIVFLWGVRRKFSELVSHNIFFSKDYKQEFEAIFSGKGIGDDPTIYINSTACTHSTDAPAGCDNWFVLLNASYNQGQDWSQIASIAKQKIIARLSKDLNYDISDSIEVEKVITPVDIEKESGSTYGSLYGISSNNRLAAFFRHPNKSKRIKGLYFCGGSVHPGGGMPLAILSATIMSGLVGTYE
jgi:phytoene desaturase